ncbi:hypothetical protein BX600DRAFT_382033 [Xylariales sp. PMI_506]|nr:hypothetical protein BX600DRAFT_382033 [Xylariales sp. PMI_506]
MDQDAYRHSAKSSAAGVIVEIVDSVKEQRWSVEDYRKWVRRQKKNARWVSGPARACAKLGTSFDAWYEKWIIQTLLQQSPLHPSKDGRHIPLSYGEVRKTPLVDERRGRAYISNFIRSSRYTIWSFVPKQLYFQFSKLANFYFLVMAILQAIPGLSTTGKFTTLATLIPFIAISMAKEGYDDYRRYQLDKRENRSEVQVLDPEQTAPKRKGTTSSKSAENVGGELATTEANQGGNVWSMVQWQNLRVGDIIQLHRDEDVPADIVLLQATGPNGVAFIETMALDGETNLKSKQACSLLAKRCDTLQKLRECKADIVSEDPNIDLYNFEGRVTVDGETMPLTLNEVVYRGSKLRNTTSAMGLVINTGEECKIRMNANKEVHAKMPAMQRKINFIVLLLVFFVVLLSVGLTIGNGTWGSHTVPRAWYLVHTWVPLKQILIGYVIMFNTLIPLSLIVSLEIIKIGQFFLMQDVEMYDPETNTPMVANTTTILEDLGQISYVFSDKTGTLTENKMRFRKLSVAGTVWTHGAEHPSSNTNDLLHYIHQKPHSTFSRKAKQFLLCIALCHTCLPETQPDGSVEFEAASPDELALVRAAEELGYLVIDRSAQSITLQTRNEESGTVIKEIYEVLDVIEFSSKRKRMSIVIRMPDGRLSVFCKGADSMILPRLKLAHLAMMKATNVSRRASMRRSMEASRELRRRSQQHSLDIIHPVLATRPSFVGSVSLSRRTSMASTDGGHWVSRTDPDPYSEISQSSVGMTPLSPPNSHHGRVDEFVAANDGSIFERCFEHVEQFASEGLRTLLFAHRYISESEYGAWKKIYHDATTCLVDRQRRIEEAGDMIEKDLDLAGASAIEDKLQVGVPETIDKLRRANIKVWMLTGDKRETAINIAHSARICKHFSDIFILDVTKGHLQETMAATLLDVSRGMIAHSVVVIDGHTLSIVEEDETLKSIFFELAIRTDSVICCRASPSQKANLVKSIQHAVPDAITLAIGDGSNDISMIQASHVGIGISGREGLQAARIADFSIAQFRFLQRLLFVHGRWNYLRTGKYVLATFWKEMLFYICQAQYQRWNGYTGTSLFESTSLAVFNTLFSSLCVILPGIFERDLSAKTLLAVPELYMFGQRNEGFSYGKYLAWSIMAIAESLIIFIVVLGTYGEETLADHNLFAFGQLIFTICIMLINTKLFILEMHSKTIVAAIGWIVSVAGWFAWNLFIAGSGAIKPTVGPYPVRSGFVITFGHQLLWWTSCLLAVAAVIVFEFCVTSLRRVYFPKDQDLWQEIERSGDVDRIVELYDCENADHHEENDSIEEKLGALGRIDSAGTAEGV